MKVPEALLTDKRKAKTEKDKADAIDKLGDWYFRCIVIQYCSTYLFSMYVRVVHVLSCI